MEYDDRRKKRGEEIAKSGKLKKEGETHHDVKSCISS